MRFFFGLIVGLLGTLTVGLLVAAVVCQMVSVWAVDQNDQWSDTALLLIATSLVTGLAVITMVMFREEITGEDR